MNAVFVDSSVWIDHFRGVATPQSRLLMQLLNALSPDSEAPAPTSILVGDLVLTEVLRGIPNEQSHRRVRAGLLSLPQVAIGGTAIALAAAEHYRALRRRGITVRKTVDCLIAAWCFARNVALLDNDRDFAPFAAHCGLKRLAPELP